MARNYRYELWNGREVVGYYDSMWPIKGESLITPEVSTYKWRYSTRRRYIEVPISARIVRDDGVDILLRKVLDVRKKSKRQIDLLKQGMKI